MTTPTDLKVASPDQPVKLSGNLGVFAIVFMVVAAAAPLTVVGGVMPVGFAFGNGLGFPLIYILSGAILLIFAVGLARMARSVPKPGAFYTYIRYGLGERAGGAAAFIALAAYTVVPAGTAAFFGFQVSAVIEAAGGPVIPWWALAALTLAAVGFLGYRNIDLTAKVLAFILIGETAIVLVLVAVIFAQGGAEGFSVQPFTLQAAFSGNFAVALAFGINSFIGIEAAAVFRDEAKNPDKTVPRSLYISIAAVAVFYALSAYGLITGFGPDETLRQAHDNPGGMLTTLTLQYLGTVGEIITQVFLVTSIFACTLAFQNVLARYLHTMAKEGLISPALGAVHAKHRSPSKASLVVSAMIAVILLLGIVANLDPVTHMLGWSSAMVVMGIMILMISTSVAVIVYFARRDDGSVWKTRIAPAVAALALATVVVLYFANFSVIAGGSLGLALGLLSVFPVAAIIGVVVATSRRNKLRVMTQRIAVAGDARDAEESADSVESRLDT